MRGRPGPQDVAASAGTPHRRSPPFPVGVHRGTDEPHRHVQDVPRRTGPQLPSTGSPRRLQHRCRAGRLMMTGIAHRAMASAVSLRLSWSRVVRRGRISHPDVRDHDCQQQAQGVDHDVPLAAVGLLPPSEPRATVGTEAAALTDCASVVPALGSASRPAALRLRTCSRSRSCTASTRPVFRRRRWKARTRPQAGKSAGSVAGPSLRRRMGAFVAAHSGGLGLPPSPPRRLPVGGGSVSCRQRCSVSRPGR